MKTTSLKTIAQSVAEDLRLSILSGELRSGEKLIEQQLAKKFGASRIPIREAVRQLEIEGYIERKTFTSLYVKGVTQEEFLEKNSLVYTLIESLAPKAISNYTPEILQELEAFVIKIKGVVTYKDWCSVMIDLSECIYGPANKPAFTKLIKELLALHLRLSYSFFNAGVPTQATAAAQLTNYISLCREGNITEATQNRLLHLKRLRENLSKLFETK